MKNTDALMKGSRMKVIWHWGGICKTAMLVLAGDAVVIFLGLSVWAAALGGFASGLGFTLYGLHRSMARTSAGERVSIGGGSVYAYPNKPAWSQ